MIKLAEKLKKSGEIEFDDKQDKMVIVFDADIFERKVCSYQELLQEKSKSSVYAVTNPAFELFLLLHIENSFEEIISPDYSLILENQKVQGSPPIYSMLLEETGMNAKRNPDIGIPALKIDVAIEQEKKINQDISDCKGKITSNIAQIISGINEFNQSEEVM